MRSNVRRNALVVVACAVAATFALFLYYEHVRSSIRVSGSMKLSVDTSVCPRRQLTVLASPTGTFRAATALQCKNEPFADPATFVFVLQNEQTVNNSAPAVIVLAHREQDLSGDMKNNGVPVLLHWSSDSSLTIHYPVGATAIRIPGAMAEAVTTHGVRIIEQGDPGLGTLRPLQH